MLSRIGNSLFWMGRYIERAEHIARFAKVQYISSLDAPLAQSRDMALESILNMSGVQQSYTQLHPELTDDAVLYYVTLHDKNPFSIAANISYIRENARGARDSISTELWEATNRFYHNINNYTAAKFHNEGIFSFSQKIVENSAILKGFIDNTLVRNEGWFLIALGVHIERAAQVANILLTKLNDIEKIDRFEVGSPVENYHWTMLLKCAESFDMYKREYNKPDRKHILEFLIFNPSFPKSITYNLMHIQQRINDIDFQCKGKEKDSLNFLAGKLATQFQFQTIEEVEGSINDFLKNALAKIYYLAAQLEKKYLTI